MNKNTTYLGGSPTTPPDSWWYGEAEEEWCDCTTQPNIVFDNGYANCRTCQRPAGVENTPEPRKVA